MFAVSARRNMLEFCGASTSDIGLRASPPVVPNQVPIQIFSGAEWRIFQQYVQKKSIPTVLSKKLDWSCRPTYVCTLLYSCSANSATISQLLMRASANMDGWPAAMRLRDAGRGGRERGLCGCSVAIDADDSCRGPIDADVRRFPRRESWEQGPPVQRGAHHTW